MKVYVGKWSILPKDWDGINGLYEKSEDEIYQEIKRQWLESGDNLIECYTPEEFEETFNHDTDGSLTTNEYFIKIF